MQHGFLQAGFAQLAHAVGHGALARQHDAVGGQDHLGIGGHNDLPAGIGGGRAHGL